MAFIYRHNCWPAQVDERRFEAATWPDQRRDPPDPWPAPAAGVGASAAVAATDHVARLLLHPQELLLLKTWVRVSAAAQWVRVAAATAAARWRRRITLVVCVCTDMNVWKYMTGLRVSYLAACLISLTLKYVTWPTPLPLYCATHSIAEFFNEIFFIGMNCMKIVLDSFS